MSDKDETKRLVADVDKDVHEALQKKLDYGETSALIRRIAETVAYGESGDKRTIYDEYIEMKRSELDDKRHDRKLIDADIDRLEQDIRELERKREQVETKEEQFIGELESLEWRLRVGELPVVDRGHGEVVHLAEKYGKPTETIMGVLRERNPDVPDYAFVDNLQDERVFSGFSEERANLPVDQRTSNVES